MSKRMRIVDEVKTPAEIEKIRLEHAFDKRVKEGIITGEISSGQCVASNTIHLSIEFTYKAVASEFDVYLPPKLSEGPDGEVIDSHPMLKPRNMYGEYTDLRILSNGEYKVYEQDKNKLNAQWILADNLKFVADNGVYTVTKSVENNETQVEELTGRIGAAHTVCCVYERIYDRTMAQFKADARLLVPTNFEHKAPELSATTTVEEKKSDGAK